MEYFLFPKKSYYITQGYGPGSYSHEQRKAIDVSSIKGSDAIYAPFSGYIAKTYVKENHAYTCWLVSNEKVICADGNSRYAVMMLTHPNDIRNLRVNQKFNQNDLILHDGNTGNATGKHLDIEISVYDEKENVIANWEKREKEYTLVNAVNPCDYLLLSDDTIIINDTYKNRQYPIKQIKNLDKSNYIIGKYITLANMKVRTGPGINYRQKIYRELTKNGQLNALYKNSSSLAVYKKGTVFDAKEIIENSPKDIWAKTPSGYVNIINQNNVNCKRK